jgi:preprotein translocase subunit SecG
MELEMNFLLLGSLAGTLLGWLMGFLSLFLIMLILVQRGKGGGLTGALGGPGGQSAFGSKAGDTFTVITVVVASVWAFTCAFTMWLLGAHAPTTTVTETKMKAGPGDSQPADQSTIPPLGGSAADLGPGGIGAAPSELIESLELTPAESTEPAADAEESSEAPADSEASASEPSASDPVAETGDEEKSE